MRIHLQYGTEGIAADIPSDHVTVLTPQFVPGLKDEPAAFRTVAAQPIDARPLKELIRARDRVAVVIPDSTRPFPSARILPWLFEALAHVPSSAFTIINGTGSHRANTREELATMLGPGILSGYRVVNHSAHEPGGLADAARRPDGTLLRLNREYVESDRRIVLGFIEPHFMAGFSGGYKGVFPALADIDSIMHYHRASVIGDPRSTWGRLEDNPTQEQIRRNGSLLPVDFCINVTLNRKREITAFFCGDPLTAHRRGCEYARRTAMIACSRRFPIVLTSNSGHPLDQNLYQAVKGMSAAAQVAADEGLILTAARCNDGFPSHGNFRKLLFDHRSPQDLLETILRPGFSMYDQWEAQLLALILIRARVGLYSEIASEEVRRAHLEPVSDIPGRIREELRSLGSDAPIAVLPEGPMTIPYIASGHPSEPQA